MNVYLREPDLTADSTDPANSRPFRGVTSLLAGKGM